MPDQLSHARPRAALCALIALCSAALLTHTADAHAQDPNAPQTFRMAFIGDVSLTWERMAYDASKVPWHVTRLDAFRDVFARADFTVANLEGVMTPKPYKPSSPAMNMWMFPAAADIFKRAGVDLVGLSNNHSYDARAQGVLDTLTAVEATGVTAFGAARDFDTARKPHIHTLDPNTAGACVAFVPAAVGTNKLPGDGPGRVAMYQPWAKGELEGLVAYVAQVRKRCNFVVVYIHWGIGKRRTPPAYVKKLGRDLVAAGAQLVVGHHPHVLQGVEHVPGGGVIAYSLGNFIFANGHPDQTPTGVFHVDLTRRGASFEIERVAMLPAQINTDNFTPHPATPDQAAAIFRTMQKLSQPLNTHVALRDGLLHFTPASPTPKR